MPFKFLTLGVECYLLDYQEFSWKYINQIVEALPDDAPIVFGKDVGSPWRNGKKSRASALE
jgi:uroporphyrinogen decarboxylase